MAARRPDRPWQNADLTGQGYSESDPRYYTAGIKGVLRDTREHAREDVRKLEEPRARVRFETTAEVIAGPARAYDRFEQRSEPGWR